MGGCVGVCVGVFAMIITSVSGVLAPAHTRHLRQLNRHSEEDQAELEALVEDKTRFLHIAVKNYILCLKAGVSGPTEKATVSHFVNLVCFHRYSIPCTVQ